MKSTMQEIPFSVARILEYGATAHANTTVSTYFDPHSRNAAPGPSSIAGSTAEATEQPQEPAAEDESPYETDVDVTTFAHIATRCAALANVLATEFGIGIGDRVATFLSNCNEHLETFLGVAAMGAVFHPVNRQLMNDQIVHVLNHAASQVVVCDPVYSTKLLPLITQCPNIKAIIITSSKLSRISYLQQELDTILGDARRVTVRSYEDLLDGQPAFYDWPELPETAPAAICYSTGTEGAPKGVVYSHRSLWLHSMALRAADSFAIRNGIPFLCCVPIYHVLSWGVPLAAFMAGTPLVFTGRTATPAHLARVIERAMPRMAHGAPTIWTSLLVHYENQPPKRMSLQKIYSGGSPVPPALIDYWEERYGVDLIHAWGMTETGPVATVAHPPAGVAGAARARYRESQGRFHVGIEYRVVGDDGAVLDANDRNAGELQVRGNTVTGHYYHSPAQDPAPQDLASPANSELAAVFRNDAVEDADDRFTDDGWLRTGDIATVNQDGFLTIHDRKADLIRSGGEWIYSAALENYIMACESVIEAAVIGIPNQRWGQRPLAVVVHNSSIQGDDAEARDAARILAEQVRAQVPHWMVPEYWTFVQRIDKTSVEKFDKKDLRAHYERGDFTVINLRD